MRITRPIQINYRTTKKVKDGMSAMRELLGFDSDGELLDYALQTVIEEEMQKAEAQRKTAQEALTQHARAKYIADEQNTAALQAGTTPPIPAEIIEFMGSAQAKINAELKDCQARETKLREVYGSMFASEPRHKAEAEPGADV